MPRPSIRPNGRQIEAPVLPAHAALLHFDLRGDFEAAFDPPVRGTIAISHDLDEGPRQASFADTVDPLGTLVPDYFVGTEVFFAGIPSTSPDEFGPVGPVSMRFGNGDALTLKPIANVQSISSVSFNRYRYSVELFMTGEPDVQGRREPWPDSASGRPSGR